MGARIEMTVRRRDQSAEESRSSILEAARAAFAEKGYAATSLEDILAPTGLTKGALYHHFANKAAVLEALYVSMEEDLVARIGVAVASAEGDARSQIATALDAFLEASGEPSYVRIVLRDAPTVLGTEKGRAIDQRLGIGMTEALLHALVGDGYLPPFSIPMAARVVLAAVSEVAVTMSTSADPDAVRREGRDVVLAMLDGLRGAAASAGETETP